MNVHEPGLATTINAEPAEPAERPVVFCEFCGFCVECRSRTFQRLGPFASKTVGASRRDRTNNAA
ncbi:MAG: hypothetical protein DMF98_08060 [Acidobacteria bacterium]|nr:MAG: hypothetical protein DMF98_08060 [Acidobacteriota bacterium]